MSDAIIHTLKFDRDGLIPTIVQDRVTGEVLMLAYMNGESLERTIQSGETWFWSRSRGELWHKGATSGHTQKVVDIRLDCDDDTLLGQGVLASDRWMDGWGGRAAPAVSPGRSR